MSETRVGTRLERLLDHIRGSNGVWVARRDRIAHHFREVMGLPPWQAPQASIPTAGRPGPPAG